MSRYKLVMFDMDGTLLNGRGIFVIAEKLGFYPELIRYFRNKKDMPFYKKSIEIAKLCKDFSIDEFLDIFHSVPLQDNLEKVIHALKEKNIKTAIATDSYLFLAEDLRKRLELDFAFANNLIIDKGVITGELEINNKELISDLTGNTYSICKEQILKDLCKNLKISVDEAIAVGDGIVDIGMLKTAGLGIAFNASDKVNKYADVITSDMKTLLEYI